MKHEYEFTDRIEARVRRECRVGIFAGIAEIGSLIWSGVTATGAAIAETAAAATAAEATASGAIAAGTEGAIGATAAGVLGDAAVGATVGAGLGAGEAAITGGDPLKGAEAGAISGGVLSGAGPLVGSALGDIGVPGAATTGDVLAGAGGGALGAAATGGNPLIGAAGGAVSGGLKAYMAGDLSATGAPSAAGPPTPTGTGGAGTGVPGGVESVTVPGTAISPVSPTLAGVGTGGGTGGAKAQSAPGSVPTGGQVGITSGGGSTNSGLPTEAVTVSAPSVASDVGLTLPGSLASSGLSQTPALAGTGGSAAGSAAPASTDQSYLDKLGNKTEDFLANPAVLLGGGLLAANATGLLGGSTGAGNIAGGTTANANQLQQAAATDTALASQATTAGNTANTTGTQLESYLTSGTLPPGMQAQIDATREAATARTTQMYANLGMTGSSSFGQDIAAINQSAAAAEASAAEQVWSQGLQQQQLATNLFQQALAATNADTAIYTGLLQTNLQQDANLSAGVNNFVTALANMSRASSLAATGAAAAGATT